MTEQEIYEKYWEPMMFGLAQKIDEIVLDVLTDNSVGVEANQELWID